MHRPPLPQEKSLVLILKSESIPGHMVLSVATEKKSSVASPGIDPETVRLIAQCLNHYVTRGKTTTAGVSYKELYD